MTATKDYKHLTPVELEWARAAEAATSGPWISEANEKDCSIRILGRVANGNVRASDGLGDIVSVDCADPFLAERRFAPMQPEAVANADLIAASRTAVPSLLDEVERLRGALADAVSVCEIYAELAKPPVRARVQRIAREGRAALALQDQKAPKE